MKDEFFQPDDVPPGYWERMIELMAVWPKLPPDDRSGDPDPEIAEEG